MISKVVMTASIHVAVQASPRVAVAVQDALERFMAGEWGDVSYCDACSNTADPMTAMGVYGTPTGDLWIKSDPYPDFRLVTILRPSEY